MAGKRKSLTIEFLGEAKTDAATRKVVDGLKGVGDAADKTGSKLKGMDGDVDRAAARLRGFGDDTDRTAGRVRGLDDVIGRGGRSFGDYGTGLGGVGDRADELDTRMMGLSDGITGVSDLMRGPGEIGAAGMAMAMADLGSAAYNTVVPSMQAATKAIKGMATAANLSAVGIVLTAAAVTAYAFSQQGATLDAEKFTDTMARLQAGTESMDAEALQAAASFTGLDGIFGKILDESPELAGAFIEQAEAAGVDADVLANLRDMLAEVEDTAEFTAGSIRGVTDAIRAQSDPTFAAIDAMRGLSDANVDVTAKELELAAAQQEFGTNSVEAMVAAQNLSDAQLDAAQAAFGQEQALMELGAAMLESGFSISDVTAHLQGLSDQGLVSQATVDGVSASLGAVPGSVTSTLLANDQASWTIDNVSNTLAGLDGQSATVKVRAIFQTIGSAFGFADGGVVPEYAATGMVVGGPRGTDTVPAWLTPGEMVLNDGQQAELWDLVNGGGRGGGGGDVIVNVHVAGSVVAERDLISAINRAADKGAKISKHAIRA